MAEIEINLLDHECLSRNIGDRLELENHVAVWCAGDNAEKKLIGVLSEIKRIKDYRIIMFHN